MIHDAKYLNSWLADTKTKLKDIQKPDSVTEAEDFIDRHQELLGDINENRDRLVIPSPSHIKREWPCQSNCMSICLFAETSVRGVTDDLKVVIVLI